MNIKARALVLLVAALWMGGLMTACGEDESTESAGISSEFDIAGGELDENGKPVFDTTGWEEPAGKADALQGKRGLSVSTDGDELSVWDVKNQWGDRDTENAREAGVAWGENSGLSWDEKYVRWIEKMERIEGVGYGDTFELITPEGRKVPAPALECAETAIFLRITFASWYNLPFFLEARDSNRNRLYFGHFGMRTEEGRYGRTPRYRDTYEDFSGQRDEIRMGEVEWPVDTKLAARQLPGTFDDQQPMLSPDAHLGAYMDHIFLNKRTGYFLMTTLLYFGSVNLADSVNTYNVTAEGVKPGDVLLERWGSNGIGHTLVVMRSRDLGTKEIDGVEVPQLEAELVSGSMPRRQPRWDSPAASKRYFVDERTGGEDFVQFNGGIKRWRTASNVSGRWTNTVPGIYVDDYINSRDKDTLSQRPERFEAVLTELSPEEKVDALVEIIDSKRQHLSQYPASCSARIAREDAFRELYSVGKENFDWDTAEVDKRFRKLEDYVFAELVYNQSKTCCWNSSTSNMYEIVMEKAAVDMADPETGECREVTVFQNYDDDQDGYGVFREFAEAMGRGDQWVEWNDDETCPQKDVAVDTQADHTWTPQCELEF